jgi:transposase InsO family protein
MHCYMTQIAAASTPASDSSGYRVVDEPLGKRLGQCRDRGFFSSLKTERPKHTSNAIMREPIVFDYFERFYNAKRRRSRIGYLSPLGSSAGLD